MSRAAMAVKIRRRQQKSAARRQFFSGVSAGVIRRRRWNLAAHGSNFVSQCVNSLQQHFITEYAISNTGLDVWISLFDSSARHYFFNFSFLHLRVYCRIMLFLPFQNAVKLTYIHALKFSTFRSITRTPDKCSQSKILATHNCMQTKLSWLRMFNICIQLLEFHIPFLYERTDHQQLPVRVPKHATVHYVHAAVIRVQQFYAGHRTKKGQRNPKSIKTRMVQDCLWSYWMWLRTSINAGG